MKTMQKLMCELQVIKAFYYFRVIEATPKLLTILASAK